ncbi:right-handed parallel beta-helix repeat-containing protein [Kordiimonas aquimaris]|uniref:right-handed parallel beta-helix repeat-containing protein n=1 Tax=Kordiimonas aquimaris TaxID=707591 RepID=UPI0021D0E454|nr:right-handed parallel beta-helix repeat-containing protein [Kordiimonas aquimaris]
MLRYLLVFTFLSFSVMPASAQGKAIYADGVLMATLQDAFDAVKPGGTIRIEPGIYKEGGELKKGHDGVLIIGAPGVVFDGVAVKGKAAFVIQSDNVTIESIACKNIRVRSKNGACVRMESANLTLKDVDFSHSENGILTWNKVNKLLIEDSIFEYNGKGGQAHGMYITGGKQLIVRRSRILNSKNNGHGIKSRAEITLVENTVVASLEGDDSYLIDAPDGGEVIVRNSLLVEGANTVNWHLLTFGPESRKYPENSFKLEKNVIISDREGGSTLFNIGEGMPTPQARGNVVVGRITYDWSDNNFFFDERADLNWPAAPALPEIDLSQK